MSCFTRSSAPGVRTEQRHVFTPIMFLLMVLGATIHKEQAGFGGYAEMCLFLSDSWDCVTTCFFIDTAHNVIEYVETIWKILKPGGVWINLGESEFILEFRAMC